MKKGTKTKPSKLTKLSKNLDIKESTIRTIVYSEHELNNLTDPKEIKTIKLDLEPKQIREIRNIAKTLKVSTDAVIIGLLTARIEQAP